MKKVFVALLVLTLLLSASMVMAQNEAVQGGTFRYGMTTNPRGMFNPILNTEVYDGYIIDVVFEGLISIDRNLQPQPAVAKDWEFSNDGLSLTFYLKEGVLFHDGVELTAEDVAYTFQTILHPHYTGVRYGTFQVIEGAEEYHAGEREDVPGIEILDDYTIRFTTSRPHAPFLAQFTYGILPSHILRDVPVAELEAHPFNSHPIGAGPFEFVEFRTDQHVILDTFQDYHEGRANIDQLVFQKISDDAVPIYLRQGSVDFVLISPEQYPEVVELPDIDTYVYESLNYNYIAFNLRQERMDDVVVRQAMKHGFDRDTYTDIIHEGFGIKANAPMPTASWAYTTEGINPYHYDPDQAAQMLSDAGWSPGPDGILTKGDMKLDLSLLVPEGRRTTEQMALLFQQNMEDIGISIQLLFMEFSAAVDRVDAREFDMFTMGWSLSVDPDPYGIWHSSVPWNDPGFYHDRSDELIELGRMVTDIEERKEIYKEWQQIINYELPYIFLSYGNSIAAMNTHIQGIDSDPGPYGPLVARNLLKNIWIPADKQ